MPERRVNIGGGGTWPEQGADKFHKKVERANKNDVRLYTVEI